MSTRTSAARYARALFDVARQEADLEAVRNDIVTVAAAVADNPELSRVLASWSVPDAVRRRIIVAVAEKMGASAPVVKLLGLLADRGRLSLLPDIASVYSERLLEHQNVVQAEVTTAVPLTGDAPDRIAAGLRSATGKQVTMRVAVDPTLLGGVVARVGGTVYDGSIRTQLKKMRDQLVAQG